MNEVDEIYDYDDLEFEFVDPFNSSDDEEEEEEEGEPELGMEEYDKEHDDNIGWQLIQVSHLLQ